MAISLGERIRRLRDKKGLSQSALAKEVGCSANYIGKIERGKTKPSPKLIEEIGYVFWLSADYLENSPDEDLFPEL